MDQRSDLRQPPVFHDVADPEPSTSACTYSSFGGQVDFYGDTDADAEADADADADADPDADVDAGCGHEDEEDDEDEPPRNKPKQHHQQQLQQLQQQQHEQKHASKRCATGHSKETYADYAPGPHFANNASFAMDMSMYVVSGIMLIFLMEQFIQIGARLR